MELVPSANTNVNTQTSFVEYSYVPIVETESDFNSFSIKIEHYVSPGNAGNIPQIKNLRAIAIV